MSKASREWKEICKEMNRDNAIYAPSFSRTSRKDMTLKAYRKQCRELSAYIRGMKQHTKCIKGIKGNE